MHDAIRAIRTHAFTKSSIRIIFHMMRSLLFILLSVPAFGQNILHYTATSGFDHGTRNVSLAMFQTIATQHGLTVTHDNDGASFNSLSTLQQYSVIVFSNTSGDALLNPAQRANFEAYIADGGSVMGIHAASDTYRHSSANGNNTGAWDFYADLIGASVQQAPNHVNGTPLYDMSHIGAHASTANLPDPWSKNEEYYYWESGYYRADNVPVLQVQETVGPNGQVNSYDAPRPMSWYRELNEGGRVFYTALGHAGSNYVSDTLFLAHIRDALSWLLHGDTGLEVPTRPAFQVFPDPVNDALHIAHAGQLTGRTIQLLDLSGRVLWQSMAPPGAITIDMRRCPDGLYLVRSDQGTVRVAMVR
jgi:type 1 glutamine amidotransferase